MLHTKLGLANKVWKDGFVTWIDSRVEDVPENVINARNNYLSADMKFRVSQAEVDELTDVVGDLKAQHVAIHTQLRERDANNQLVLQSRSSQRRDANDRLEDLKRRQAYLKEQKKEVEEELARNKKVLQEAKKQYDAINEKRSWEDRLMIAQIEKILEKFHVSMGQYHGRDMEGPAINRLLANVAEIFTRIKSLLIANRTVNSSIPEAEIIQMCDSYRDMFLLLEGLFHYMKLPNEVVTDKDKGDLERFIKLTMRMWRALNLSVTVKAHVVESHLLAQIEMYKGLGDFVEEFIELLHQDTKRFRRRMGHLPDFEQQSSAMIFWNRLENLAPMKEEQEKVLSGSKRKLKRYNDGLESVSNERKKVRKEEADRQRQELLTRLEAQETFGYRIPTELERHREDHRQSLSSGITE